MNLVEIANELERRKAIYRDEREIFFDWCFDYATELAWLYGLNSGRARDYIVEQATKKGEDLLIAVDRYYWSTEVKLDLKTLLYKADPAKAARKDKLNSEGRNDI